MKIKQLLLTGLLIGASIQADLCNKRNAIDWGQWQDSSCQKDAAEEFAESFSSGVPLLDDLEINKLGAYAAHTGQNLMDKAEQFSELSTYKFTNQEMLIIQRFIGKGAGLVLRIGMTLSQLQDRAADESLLIKEINQLIINIVSSDPELTKFVVNPICYLSNQAETWIAKQGPDFLDEDDFLQDLFGYVPRVKDAFSALIQYNQWSREYLRIQNEQNNVITFNDFCYVTKQFAEFLEFPEKSKEFWNGLIDAISTGAKELHQDVHAALNDAVQAWLESDDFDRFMSDVVYANNVRKELAAKAQIVNLTQKDLDFYSASLDAVLEHGSFFDSSLAHLVKNAQSKLPLVEKLVFKN